MESLGSLILFFVICFAGATGASFLLARRAARKYPLPNTGAMLRLRTDSGIYRSHLVDVSQQGWRVASPLQRDRYVPMLVGDSVIVETSAGEGSVMFRTRIVGRDVSDHSYLLAHPEEVHRRQRREHPRIALDGRSVMVDGIPAVLLNLSSMGAKIVAERPLAKGDRLNLHLRNQQHVGAWVLAAEGREARIRFEESIDLESETAPA